MKAPQLILIRGALAFGLAALPMVAQAPDNTGVNKRDNDTGTKTAGTQMKASKEDVEMTRKIRSSVTDDKNLSTYAHNVKIVTMNGKVTLRGPVRSEEERKAVEAKAAAVVGEGNVTNKLQVTMKKEKTK